MTFHTTSYSMPSRSICDLRRRQYPHQVVEYIVTVPAAGGVIAVPAEAGKDHRAVVELGNHCQELRNRRNAANQPRGDHRVAQLLAIVATLNLMRSRIGRAFIDRLVSEHVAGKQLVKECSMAKLWQTEMLGRVANKGGGI